MSQSLVWMLSRQICVTKSCSKRSTKIDAVTLVFGVTHMRKDIPFLLAMGIQFIVNAAIHGDAALIVILDLESFETPYLYPRLFSIEIKPLPPTVCDFPFPEPCPATQKNRPFELLSTLSSLFQEKLQLFFGMKIWRSVRHRVQFNTVNGISACYYPELPPTIEYRFDLSQSVVDGLLRVSLLLPPDLEPFNFAPRNLINARVKKFL